MKSFLARIRRLFYGGTVALVITMIVSYFTEGMNYFDLWKNGFNLADFSNIFCLFLAITPLAYILFLILSSAFIRIWGQSAIYQQQKPFIYTFFLCVLSDIKSPFKCISGFVVALTNNFPSFYPAGLRWKSRIISTWRFIWMILIISFCVYGMMQINDFSTFIQVVAKMVEELIKK